MNDDFFPPDGPGEPDGQPDMPGSEVPSSPGEAGGEARVLARLREALLASAPAVDPGMVHGETLEELEGSFAAAVASLERVREAVRRELAAAIPVAGGGRAPAPRLSPLEKIRAGLAR